MSVDRSRPKVVFVGGYGRSGSTLLDRVLGTVDGFFSAGEIRHLWFEGLFEGRRCGCGEAFGDCAVWQAILERAFGAAGPDVAETLALKSKVDRFFRVPQIAGRFPRSFDRDVDEYALLLGRLYRAIAEVSGSDVIVDSTKDVSHGWLLTRVDDIDLRVVHLVRDSRATAYSWRRKKFNPGSGRDMDRWGVLRSALEWNAINALTRLLGRTGHPYMTLRYEDLVEQPSEALAGLLAFLGEEHRPIPMAADASLELGIDHTVAGNPLRFKRGRIQINPDAEWKQQMDPAARVAVALLTWPSLYRYGYGGQAERAIGGGAG
jgi:hypothetical protein